MKKTIAVILTLGLLALTLGGCAEKTAPEANTGAEPQSGQSVNEPSPTPSAGGQTEIPSGEGEGSGSGTGASEPVYGFYSAGLTEEGFFEGVTASDLVQLPAYRGLPIPAAAVAADPGEVESFLRTQVLAPYAETVEITDRPVENFDTVNIDYTGYMDEVAFDGGSTRGMGTDVIIGVTSYIDDFLEQLIGHMPGENFDIFVTFPDPYLNNPDLAGREARFNITINYISESSEVELTDAIAQDYGFADKAGLRERVEELLLDDARNSLVSGILSQAVCAEVPESVIAYYENYFIGYYSVNYGMDFSENPQELLEGNEETIRSLAVTYLAAQAICEKEGLRADESDLEAIGILPYLDIYGLPFAMQSALMDRVLPEFIIANGTPEA